MRWATSDVAVDTRHHCSGSANFASTGVDRYACTVHSLDTVGKMIYVTTTHDNVTVVPILCYDIVVLRGPRRYRRSRSYDSGPIISTDSIVDAISFIWYTVMWYKSLSNSLKIWYQLQAEFSSQIWPGTALDGFETRCITNKKHNYCYTTKTKQNVCSL